MKILGVRNGHDAGASIVIDGNIIADIAEERLTRIKHDGSFPIKSIDYCLKTAGISSNELDVLAFPEKTVSAEAFVFFDIPDDFRPSAMKTIKKFIKTGKIGNNLPVLPIYQEKYKLSGNCKIYLSGHHRAHAASAYYTSGINPKDKTLIITMDGAGDGISVGIWEGLGNKIQLIKSFGTNSSLSWFYGNATEALGWRHGSGEWKLMGLAPYGTPQPGKLKGFYPEFSDGNLVKPHKFNNFGRWNDHGANHYHGQDAIYLNKILQKMKREDFAAEVQRVVEEQAFKLILPLLKTNKSKHLCCAGGFFLNVKFNQKLWYTGKLETQWIYPDSGDSGIALGAALDACFHFQPETKNRKLDHLYYGPEFSNIEIKELLDERFLSYQHVENPSLIAAKYLSKNLTVGWFQNKMESGPRALGNRSILMSPLKKENKDIINAKIKYREKFRPFCPSMLYEKKDEYLINAREEAFMVTSFEVKQDKINKIPAVVHEDNTARPQMITKEINPLYYQLIEEFGKLTGEYVILNTSFNIRGEPIVCHPREAIRCFFDTGLDVLVLGNFVLTKPVIKNNDVFI